MERTRRLANSGEVSSQHLVGFFKDECTNLLWRRAAGWLDWMGRDKPERQRIESQWIFAGKTNLSHDGLNAAHVPYWWVNNPTLGEFCFIMIGRAEIEGSKSNVAMNAWLPQASYPYGNFSDTSSFKFRRFKGSLGHAFTIRICTGNQNQKSFYPSVPHEISSLVEFILGHLRYLLTDVPPQPNSPPDNVFRPDRPAERALGPKRGAVPRFRFTE
ncbi:Regulator of rDNA transcription protein 15 [Capsicum baccatum]|uniref:Regulator of rDNA transcription protein 15 n=1 Tax=Capsicum baccatum TaxID=33114 RepID=A0A2G2V4J9_CAPBA|nr:Regulator of rDNA transcription protein 15 [Capsicum baccatum]